MDKIISNIIYGFLWLLSKLPFKVLYFISDIIYLFIYYIIGYRKSIVRRNLKSFFPEKTDFELKNIEKKFYKHFVDIFIEMIKSFSISIDELNKRFKIINAEVINKLYDNDKSVILNSCHYGNWEWVIGMGQHIEHYPVAIYSRIKNKFLDSKIKQNRSRFGIELVLKHHISKVMYSHAKADQLYAYGFLSDQSPKIGRAYYWSSFLGARVPVFTGAEYFAKKHDLAMVYVSIKKVKRGFYTCDYELLTENPNEFKDFELTELYLKKVEAQIKEEPAYYLWTHNRLKKVGKEHLKPEVSSW